MARPLYASFLPTIKCSSCGVEIEISAMGDHLCTGNPEAAQPQIGRTDHDRIPASYLIPPGQTGSSLPLEKRDNALAVPGIPGSDGDNAREETASDNQPQPAPLPTFRIGVTEAAQSTGNAPVGGRASIPPRSYTEPNSITARPSPNSTTASSGAVFPTRKAIARTNAPNHLPLPNGESSTESAPATPYGPLSPSLSSGANLLKRMDSIAPGPFNSRSRTQADRGAVRSPQAQAAGGTNPFEAGIRNGASNAAQPPSRPARPETDDSLTEQLQAVAIEPASGPSSQSPNVPHVAETESTEDPAFKRISPLRRYSQANRGHSLTDSESSTVSQSGSDSRTASSRSSHSPLASNASADMNHKLSLEHNAYSASGKEHVHNQLEKEAPDGMTLSGAKSIVEEVVSPISPRSELPQTIAQVPAVARLAESSTSQARASSASIPQQAQDGEQRLSSLRYDPNERNGKASGPAILPPHLSEARRRTAAPKYKCRGCGDTIVGKSIRAADGRLSGRWHRDCFTCHTCKTPFQTMDFYVLDDQPYCAHDYHVLNKSLCHQCETGIEGRYLETQPSQKYHVDCFICHDCRKPLTKDYFEMNQHFYCEADAFRVWQKSKMLTPGKRFPERRTTRLMTMA